MRTCESRPRWWKWFLVIAIGIDAFSSCLFGGTNQVSNGIETAPKKERLASIETIPAGEGGIFPTNAVLRIIEWKHREAEERSIIDFTSHMKNMKNMAVTFQGWHARIVGTEEVSSGRFLISVEIGAKFVGKGTITDTSRILETWIVDREQGVVFERRTGRKGGFYFQD